MDGSGFNFVDLLRWLWVAVLAPILYQIGVLHKRSSTLRDELTSHRIKVAEEYATRAELKDSIEKLTATIEKGFSRIEDKLDGKADK